MGTRTITLPSGRKLRVFLGQRFTREMLEALDEQADGFEEIERESKRKEK